MNNETTKERIPAGVLFAGCHALDSRLTKLYLDWLRDKPIQVVLSSSWRHHPHLMEILKEGGISWIDTTPGYGFRGREVEVWISAQRDKPIEAYAILDDMQQFYSYQNKHFVQTNYVTGLTEADLKRVEEILGLNPPSSNGRTTDFESVN